MPQGTTPHENSVSFFQKTPENADDMEARYRDTSVQCLDCACQKIDS